MSVISGEQLRAARALVRWDQRHVAEAAAVSIETVKRLELTEGPVSAYAGTVEALRRALEEAGVMFLDADEHGGPGVRFKASASSAAPHRARSGAPLGEKRRPSPLR